MKTYNVKRGQLGQSMAEFSISLPFLAPIVLVLIMLLIQWATIYRDKMTLNAATFDAVRSGTLNHGSMAKMREALAQGMTPLFMRDESSGIEVGRAYLLARAYVEGSNMLGVGAQIKQLHPTNEVYEKHKVLRKDGSGNVWYEIPNDNLMYRNPVQKHIKGDVFLNVQDANLLKIEVNWCKKLEVPIANWVIGKILTFTDVSINPFDEKYVNYVPSTHQLGCNALGLVSGADGTFNINEYYISLKSYAIARMQTPYRQQDSSIPDIKD